jgi:hypothetical protein
MTRLRIGIALILTMALSPACVDEFDFEWDDVDGLSANLPGMSTIPWTEGQSYQDLRLRQGTLQGRIGAVAHLDHTATDLSGWDDGYFTTLEVTVETVNGAAMAIIDIVGGLDNLPPGMVVRQAAGTEQALQVYLTGCSGPQAGVWDYDMPAEDVVVSAVEVPGDPDAITLNFSATLTDAYDLSGGTGTTSVVTGSVTVVLPQ